LKSVNDVFEKSLTLNGEGEGRDYFTNIGLFGASIIPEVALRYSL
jgi:hypothetical protein